MWKRCTRGLREERSRRFAGASLAWALAAATALVAGQAAGAAASADAAAVRHTFQTLKSALARNDGEAAAELLTARSLLYYRNARGMALRGSRSELAALAPGDRLVVLSLRHRNPPYLGRDGSPRELVSRAVASESFDAAQVDRSALAAVTVERDRARAGLRLDGFPAGLVAYFVREEAIWKLDLPPTAASVGTGVRIASQLSGASEDAVLLELLGRLSGRAPEATVWHPLQRDAPADRRR